jgi:hypothetical protein
MRHDSLQSLGLGHLWSVHGTVWVLRTHGNGPTCGMRGSSEVCWFSNMIMLIVSIDGASSFANGHCLRRLASQQTLPRLSPPWRTGVLIGIGLVCVFTRLKSEHVSLFAPILFYLVPHTRLCQGGCWTSIVDVSLVAGRTFTRRMQRSPYCWRVASRGLRDLWPRSGI